MVEPDRFIDTLETLIFDLSDMFYDAIARLQYDRDIDMTRSEAELLVQVYRDEGLSAGDLADRLSLDFPDMEAIVERLESRSLLRVDAARKGAIVLGDNAADALDAMRACAFEVLATMQQNLTPDELDELIRLLKIIRMPFVSDAAGRLARIPAALN